MNKFVQLLQRLADSGLDFVIVGGYAALAHGSTLMTRDLDICAALTPANVERLRQTLAEFNPRHRMTPQRLSFLKHPAPDEPPARSLDLETDIGVIDILTSIIAVGDFERLSSTAEEVEMGGRTYRLIALDDLIRSKEALSREKDLPAVKELRAIAAKKRPVV
jgi:predicted nucleotidyltransferase